MKKQISFLVLSFFFTITLKAEIEKTVGSIDPITYLTQQNYRVLSGRIHKILEYRFSNLNQCSNSKINTLNSQFRSLPAYSHEQKQVLKHLSIYFESYQVEINCLKSLNSNEYQFYTLERSKFKLVQNFISTFCAEKDSTNAFVNDKKCSSSIEKVIADLDPHCVSVQVPNNDNKYDAFPCMAGDFLGGRNLVSNTSWQSFLQNNQSFLNTFRALVNDPNSKKTGIDLWEIFKAHRPDSPELREEFLSSLNFYFSSFHSASSYIRGFHDHIWRFILFKTKSAESTLNYFIHSRLLVDEFRTLNTWSDKNQIPLRFSGITMQNKNRHNYMAAFLACHYRDKGFLVRESLPVVLGYAYETFDFKSHYVDENLSFKESKDNFITDTDRYRTGVYWGYRFCKN